MRVMTTIPQHYLAQVPDATRAIEAKGYDGVPTLENRHDPFMPLGVAAINSKRLQLSTGIAIAFARSPMTVANIGWDLQTASGGVSSSASAARSRAITSGAFPPPGPRRRRACGNTPRPCAPSGTTGRPAKR